MTALELKEFQDIVDADGRGESKPPTDGDLRKALQILLARQFIYSDDRQYSRYYEIVLAHRIFFEKYFGAMGYELLIESRDQMVGLKPAENLPRSDSLYFHLKKDETLLLLCLKLAYQEAINEANLQENARVEVSSEDILSKLETIGEMNRPDERRFKDILNDFKRRGFIRLGDYDPEERVTPIMIMPGVDHLVSNAFIARLLEADTDMKSEAGEQEIEAAEDDSEDCEVTDV